MNISSCASQTSTSIIHNTNSSPSSSSSIELKLPSSSSMSPSRPATAPRLLDGSGGGAGGGGRAIDRHNPIVTDGKRSLHISGSLTNTPIPSPYPPSIITTTPPTTNSPSPSQKINKSTTTKKKKNHHTAAAPNKLASLTKKNELSHHRHHQYTDQTALQSSPAVKKTVSNPTTTTEIVTNSVKDDCLLVRTKRGSLVKPWLQDYITQPDTDSARYLLASDAGNVDTTVNDHHEPAVDTDGEDHDAGAVGFFDELLRFEKHDSPSDSIIMVGADSDNELVAVNYSPSSSSPSDGSGTKSTKDDAAYHSYNITSTSITNNTKSLTAASKSPKSLAPSSTTCVSSDLHQVVVLRVSLHCRGCEGKVRKHISRMKGVKSFNIDFAAKKVTVVGDVTPLGVLASISKVKTAQLWTPPASSAASMEINRRRTAVV